MQVDSSWGKYSKPEYWHGLVHLDTVLTQFERFAAFLLERSRFNREPLGPEHAARDLVKTLLGVIAGCIVEIRAHTEFGKRQVRSFSRLTHSQGLPPSAKIPPMADLRIGND